MSRCVLRCAAVMGSGAGGQPGVLPRRIPAPVKACVPGKGTPGRNDAPVANALRRTPCAETAAGGDCLGWRTKCRRRAGRTTRYTWEYRAATIGNRHSIPSIYVDGIHKSQYLGCSLQNSQAQSLSGDELPCLLTTKRNATRCVTRSRCVPLRNVARSNAHSGCRCVRGHCSMARG